MDIQYRKADREDAGLLIEIYNASFQIHGGMYVYK